MTIGLDISKWQGQITTKTVSTMKTQGVKFCYVKVTQGSSYEDPQWRNYIKIFDLLPFAKFAWNTLVVTGLAVLGTIVCQWFWRVADAAGRPRSETRRLVVVEDRPPTPFSPMAGEIVLAPPGVQVPFWWTAVDGASRYRLEIAAEPSFRNLAFSDAASGPGLWAALDHARGFGTASARASSHQTL